MIDKIKNLYTKYHEVVNYIIAGGLTTVINWVVYIIFISMGIQMTICNAIAWVVSVLFAFFANKIFVFESKTDNKISLIKELVLFFGSRILSGFVDIILPEQLCKMGLDMIIFGIEGIVAKIITNIIVIILNYILSKLVVFKKN